MRMIKKSLFSCPLHLSLEARGKQWQNYKKNVKSDMDMISCNSRILRDKTMADKLIYIPNDDTQNYPFCRLQ